MTVNLTIDDLKTSEIRALLKVIKKFDNKSKLRDIEEIHEALEELIDKLWYNRHLSLKNQVETGKEKMDPKKWKEVLAGAEKIKNKYGGEENLVAYDDFEWGMINGKISAIRWIMGEDWDELYT